jgi:hypothetical protein
MGDKSQHRTPTLANTLAFAAQTASNATEVIFNKTNLHFLTLLGYFILSQNAIYCMALCGLSLIAPQPK